jgi:hypothetical protein
VLFVVRPQKYITEFFTMIALLIFVRKIPVRHTVHRISLSISKKILIWQHKIGHDCCLPHAFKFIIYDHPLIRRYTGHAVDKGSLHKETHRISLRTGTLNIHWCLEHSSIHIALYVLFKMNAFWCVLNLEMNAKALLCV